MIPNYSTQNNINWQQKYIPQVKRILTNNAMRLITIEDATVEEDKHQATDLVAHITGGDVAVRIRRDDCQYRDWTIRSKILSGKTTELAKLLKGFGDWYLYCWTNPKRTINEWIFIDLNKVRKSGLLDKIRLQKDIPNNDGTYFKNCTIVALIQYECLMSYQHY